MASEHSLLQDSIIYLAAAVVCIPLASRLKFGSVLGYLSAGALIGPFGLRLVDDPVATMHFSEFGVVLMLFLIGLELDPKHLWTMRRAVFRGGAMQLVVCSVALFGGLSLLGLPWQGALVGGIALSLSSTAVAMQTMAERNLTQATLGRSAFGILLFQDIAAIPLVAVVPLLADSSGSTSAGSGGYKAALAAVGAIVATIAVGRTLVPRLLRVVAKTGLREVFTASTLLLVFGVAQVMNSVGVSMALGAFLAGVVLAGSEYRHALETDIEPFKGLLMGLFFMAVGMSIDFALLMTEPLLTLALVLGFQVLKTAGLGLIATRLGVAAKQRWLFAALLAQGGEFAFVVFGVARTARLLPGNWDARLTLAVALSMALTPLLLWLEHKLTERKAVERPDDEIVDEGAHVIVAGFGRFGQIVGRLLFANGIKATVLDHDPEQIELLSRFEFRVYYGDASRIDLLQAAGAGRADVLVNAIDDPETSLRLVDAVREHFPNLKIVARARNLGHLYQLRSRGIEVVERETFESALMIGRRTLEALGIGAYEARESADRFRRQNVDAMERIFPHWHDEAKRVAMARSAREELEKQFEADRAELAKNQGRSWHPEQETDRSGDS